MKDSQVLIDTLSDLYLLSDEAHQAVLAAMLDGVEHGYRGEWLNQTREEHIEHAFKHLKKVYKKGFDVNEIDAEEHLDHAMCRIAMALVTWGRKG